MSRVVVVGAGLYGLITAKTYLQVTNSSPSDLYADDIPACFTRPQDDTAALLIVDAVSDLGGTWAQERLYPNLLSQNSYGVYEYSDLPLASVVSRDPNSQFIAGWQINRYLHIWCKKWDLHKHLRLRWKVASICRLPTQEWQLCITITTAAAVRHVVLLCDKLVLATGLTSEPNTPYIPYHGPPESPQLPVIHAKHIGEFCRAHLGYTPLDRPPAPATQPPPPLRVVAIHGAAKSAFDLVHLFAGLHLNPPAWHLAAHPRHPVHVHWIIDDRRAGPAWMAAPTAQLLGAVVPSDQAASTRLLSLLHPCEPLTPTPDAALPHPWAPYLEGPRLRRLLHGNPIGRWLVRRLWTKVDAEMATTAGYGSSAKMEKLRPARGVIECGSSGGIANQPDFWPTLRAPHVHIYRSGIAAFSGSATSPVAHLHDGSQTPPLDLVVHATGWRARTDMRVEPVELARALGLAEAAREWTPLEQEVEGALRRCTPAAVLGAESPRQPRDIPPSYRLFRRMVVPELVARGDRSVVVVGVVSSGTVAVVAEVQALWATAFLTGGLDQDGDVNPKRLQLDRVAESELRRAVAEDVVWGRMTGSGLEVDAIRYNDQLLRDLGLDPYRSGGGFWRECTAVYRPASYATIVDEYRRKP